MKRSSERQLSKDDFEREEDSGNDDVGQTAPEVADEATMSTRKIFRARRRMDSAVGEAPKANPFAALGGDDSAPKAPLPHANPFASLGESKAAEPPEDDASEEDSPPPASHAASALPTTTAAETEETAQSNTTKDVREDVEASGAKSDDRLERTATDAAAAGAQPETKAEADGNTASGVDTQPDAGEQTAGETGALNDVDAQQNGTNKFGSFKFAFGSSQRPFSFSSEAAKEKPFSFHVPALSSAAKPDGEGGGAPSLFGAAGSSAQPGFAAFGTSVGASDDSAAAGATASAHEPMAPAQSVPSGEEDEEENFRCRVKLFQLESDEKMQWKERGVGVLKLNQHRTTGRARLIMRADGSLRVVINVALWRDFRLNRANERSARFAAPDADKKVQSYLVKLPLKEDLDRLIFAVATWREGAAARSSAAEGVVSEDKAATPAVGAGAESAQPKDVGAAEPAGAEQAAEKSAADANDAV